MEAKIKLSLTIHVFSCPDATSILSFGDKEAVSKAPFPSLLPVLHHCLLFHPSIPIMILLYIAAPILWRAVKKNLDHSFPAQYPPRSLARGWIAFGSLSWFPQHIQTFFPVPSFLLPSSPFFPFRLFILLPRRGGYREGREGSGDGKSRERERIGGDGIGPINLMWI